MAKAIARTKKKAPATSKKKVAARKTAPKTKATANRKAAADKRTVLANKLRADLKAAKDTLKATRDSAKAEIAVLKDQLNAAMKREAELLKIGQSKVRAMVTAGEKWEKAQLPKNHKIETNTKQKNKLTNKKKIYRFLLATEKKRLTGAVFYLTPYQ